MSELDERQVQVNREIDTARARLLNSLAAESAAADDGVRRLLTEQGGALVEAVTDALQNLGFVVRDMDPVWGSAPKREDLRVSDPDYPDWTAIVEVRGYSGGAALNDLVRLHGRFRTMYNKEAGYLPTRTWYIVNQFRETDPSDRPVILASHEGELQAYGEDGVLALDTRTLFRLLMAVERGDIPARDCREQLRDATGRYEPF